MTFAVDPRRRHSLDIALDDHAHEQLAAEPARLLVRGLRELVDQIAIAPPLDLLARDRDREPPDVGTK